MFRFELRPPASVLIFAKNHDNSVAMPPPILDDRNKQDSHRAKVRIGVAAALLVTAIAILSVLSQRRTEKTVEEPEAPVTSAQTSLSSADMELSSAPLPEETPPAAPPETAAPPAETPPPPPEPGKLPDTAPAAARKAPAALAVEEESTGAAPEKPFVASASQTLARPQTSATAVQAPPRTPSLTPPPAQTSMTPVPKVFEVQLGVFTDIDNAKQLQAKLTEHGIPSHTETRVQIGPFKSREEADRAREKLKKLGITAVVRGK